MSHHKTAGLCFIFFLALGVDTEARPVGFQDSFSIISENGGERNSLLFHYSPHYRFSLGARHLRLVQEDENIYAGLAQLGFLVKRWNAERFQANVYAFGGAGGAHFKESTKPTYLAGAQIDAENRRFYSFFRFSSVLSKAFQDDYNYKARLGVAPYLARYDELNGWVMLQYDNRPGQRADHRLTPFIRLFYRNLLLEIGSSTRGDWMLNFITEI